MPLTLVRRFPRACLALGLALSLAACSSKPPRLIPPAPIAGLPDKVELGGVPFFRSVQPPGAEETLAAALRQQNIAVTPGMVEAALGHPASQAQMNEAMAVAARQYGLLVYPLEPRLEALMFQVAAGYPVLVAYRPGPMLMGQARYALLVGFDRFHKEVVLRAGQQRRLRLDMSDFSAAWGREGNWAVLLQQPVQLPARVDEQRWREAAAQLGQAGQEQAAAKALEALKKR